MKGIDMNDTLIETILYRGYEIEVHYDTDSESPDHCDNEDIYLVYDHRQFSVKPEKAQEIFEHWNESKPWNNYWLCPVLAYIHSEVRLSLGSHSRGFDSSFKGFVLVSKEHWPLEIEAVKSAKHLIDEWNQYLSGEVYGYEAGGASCWGFYGDDGKTCMIKEAKKVIDYQIQKKLLKHFTYLKQIIRNKLPLIYRKPLTFNC
jgi:hypothetical protein